MFYVFGLKFGRETPVTPGAHADPDVSRDPAALRRKRIEAARKRRAGLELRVQEEETLLFEEEERDLLKQELKEIQEARKARRP